VGGVEWGLGGTQGSRETVGEAEAVGARAGGRG
jgi:hypothetical protein